MMSTPQTIGIHNIQIYMGSILSRKKIVKMEEKPTVPQEIEDLRCPICNLVLRSEQLNEHLILCQEEQILEEEQIISQIIEQDIAQKKNRSNITGFIDVKIPTDETFTKFEWKKVEINPLYNSYGKTDIELIKKLDFPARFVWLKHQIFKLRSDGTKECKTISIDKSNLIESSLALIKEADSNCQIKIQFIGEPTQDAGGLMRELFYLLVKEFTYGKQSIFESCHTQEPLLKIRKSLEEETNIGLIDKFRLLGFILAKAIIENITLQCNLCWPLLRQIFKQDSAFDVKDIYHYDSQFFKGLIFLKNNNLDHQDLDLYFTYQSQKESHQLVPGGSTIKVTNANKEFYIFSLIQFLFITNQPVLIHAVRSELFRYIPKEIFTIFELYELEMILNGKPMIDLQEWRTNTVYQGQFHQAHQNIQWFWQTLYTFSQEQLPKLLKFVTGISRPCLQSFQKLECNRGKCNKFQICSEPMRIQNPYPKGFTCFNRLILPLYPSKDIQEGYLKVIVNGDLDGIFGLE